MLGLTLIYGSNRGPRSLDGDGQEGSKIHIPIKLRNPPIYFNIMYPLNYELGRSTSICARLDMKDFGTYNKSHEPSRKNMDRPDLHYGWSVGWPRFFLHSTGRWVTSQCQWPPISIPAESIPACMFCTILVIPAQSCDELLCRQGNIYWRTDWWTSSESWFSSFFFILGT